VRSKSRPSSDEDGNARWSNSANGSIRRSLASRGAKSPPRPDEDGSLAFATTAAPRRVTTGTRAAVAREGDAVAVAVAAVGVAARRDASDGDGGGAARWWNVAAWSVAMIARALVAVASGADAEGDGYG
jgi:hypothetical protein